MVICGKSAADIIAGIWARAPVHSYCAGKFGIVKINEIHTPGRKIKKRGKGKIPPAPAI